MIDEDKIAYPRDDEDSAEAIHSEFLEDDDEEVEEEEEDDDEF